MQLQDDLIVELSDLCGIVHEYWDIFGKKHETTIETRKAILKAMGLETDSTDEIIREVQERKTKPWKEFVEPVHVVSVNTQPLTIPVHIPIEEGKESGLTISWCFISEEKTSSGKKKPAVVSMPDITMDEIKQIDGVRCVKALVVDTERRDIGYYTFHAECRHPEMIFPGGSNKLCMKSRIIVTPDACYMPARLKHRKTWGLSTNLYAINSKRNWGIGDCTDLQHIVQWLAVAQGSFIGINPLHALPNTYPFGVSPYAPLSRLYRNFIYLDVERVQEVADSDDLQDFISSEMFQSQLREVRGKELIDYEAVAAIKENILRKAFDLFLQKHYVIKTKRGREFQGYVAEEGSALESFALFMALWKHMIETRNVFSWKDWPEEYQNIDGEAAVKFKKKHAQEILFYQYLQWLMDCQLKEVCRDAKRQHVQIGLYFDLAVGSVGGGSDAWSHKACMAQGATVGAPPDDFSPDGQQWGFPPLIPEKMRATGYELFIQTIRKNMKYGGAMRIDHALGLFRIFWVPDAMMPKEGAYVQQPYEDLLRIIALESVRNKTVVIAEDLGTIGENVRETLKRYRMLSYRLFYFERNYPEPSFMPPDKYPELALCAVTTHDLPTLYGYWNGRDIDTRRNLVHYSDDVWQKHLDDRVQDKRRILEALRSQSLIPEGYPVDLKTGTDMSSNLCLAIYKYLAKTPCKLLLVSLDDIIGTLEQQNLPGTVTEHPNWVQKTPLTLEEIINDQRLTDLAGAMKKRSLPKTRRIADR